MLLFFTCLNILKESLIYTMKISARNKYRGLLKDNMIYTTFLLSTMTHSISEIKLIIANRIKSFN